MKLFHPVLPSAIAPLSPEAELLLCCSRTQVTATHIARIQALIQHPLDWPGLLALAESQGVAPLLHTQLATICPTAVPDDVRSHLQTLHDRNFQKNLSRTIELLQIVGLLTAHGIAVRAFKGATLAQKAYGNLALREFVDLDILVPETQVVQASHLLVERGYAPQFELTDAQLHTYAQLRNEHTFWHHTKEIAVDLHWELLPRSYSFSPPPELLWADCDWVPFTQQALPTLPPEPLLLFLCAHGAKHNWSRLCWICDVAELLRVSPQLDWERLHQSTGQLGSRRMLRLGLFLAHHLLGAALPEPMLTQIQGDAAVQRLAQTIQASLFQPTSEPTPRGDAVYRGTMESHRDRLWYWFDIIFTPTPLEWQAVPLPQPLYPLYYAIRLLRLTTKHLLRRGQDETASSQWN
jgi:hypothetical protein